MNLFNKISKVFKKTESKPKELPMHIQISNLLESGIEKRKLDLNNKPKDLSRAPQVRPKKRQRGFEAGKLETVGP